MKRGLDPSLALLSGVTLCALLASVSLSAAGTGTLPDLRTDLRMHSAPIVSSATDRTGRFLLTASEDRTVRLWDLHQQAITGTFFLPTTQDQGQVPRAVALSPDAQVAVAVGQSATHPEQASVYLWERVSGRLQKRIEGPPGSTLRTHFASDAAQLWILSSRDLWSVEMKTGHRVTRLGGCDGQYVDGDWASDGRLALLCSDGTLSVLDAHLGRLAQIELPPGGHAHRVRFAPHGREIALSYAGIMRIEIRAATDLKLLREPSVTDLTGGSLMGLAWTASGRALLTAGRHPDGRGFVRRWNGAGEKLSEDVTLGVAAVTDLVPLSGAKRPEVPSVVLHRDFSVSSAAAQDAIAILTSEPAVWLLGQDGKTSLVRQRRALLPRPGTLAVDLTGNRIELVVQGKADQRIQFVVSERRLRLTNSSDSRVQLPRLRASGLVLSDWSLTGRLQINGRSFLPAGADKQIRHVTVAPDGSGLLVATDAELSFVNTQAHATWSIALDSPPQSVTFSGDGRVVICALAEGSVRWMRTSDGEPVLSLLGGADLESWILWTPSGYFETSAGRADEYVGWLVSEGPDRAPAFFHLSQMQESLRRPDVVERMLPTLDEERALAEANAEASLSTPPLRTLLPPILQLEGTDTELAVSAPMVKIPISVRSLSGAPVLNVRATILDTFGQSRRVIIPVSAPSASAPPPLKEAPPQRLSLELQVPPSDGSLLLQAETAYATSEPAIINLRWHGLTKAAAAPKPNLFVLAVGISSYKIKQYQLDYPAKDATDLVKTLKKQEGRLYDTVTARAVLNGDATRARILEELAWLRKNATSSDIIVVFLAGHGADDPLTGRYQFFPYEADFSDVAGTLLSASNLRTALDAIEGKVVLLLDACHAGNVVAGRNSAMTSGLRRFADQVTGLGSSTIVFSAATGDQTARESVKWNNGAFTKAVVEGLTGKADPSATGFVTVAGLESYVSERVAELTTNRQTPAVAKPAATVDFRLTQVRKPPYRQGWFWASVGLGAATVVGISLAIARPWAPQPPEISF